MTIFDAVRKEDLDAWWIYIQGTNCNMGLPTIKAISLEDLRKEIEGMFKSKELDIGGRIYAYNQALDDLLKKLEEKDPRACPKCGKIMEINGLYCKCSCGHMDDSTYSQIIMGTKKLEEGR